jgi:flagellar protein FliS
MMVTQQRNQYLRDQILNATPARLLTMLYDRLLLDLNRAEAAQATESWAAASEQLIHAQAIVSELASSLKSGVWDGSDDLFATYIYVNNALMNANITRNIGLTREARELITPLREAWHEAAAMLPGSVSPAPQKGGMAYA